MFPAEHTKLHIFNKSSKVWEDKHAGKSFNFKIFHVATTFTPKMVIENVLKGAEGADRWAITEVVEKGDGAWAKVSLFFFGFFGFFGLIPSLSSSSSSSSLSLSSVIWSFLGHFLLILTFQSTGHDDRVRRRASRLFAREHGLDWQARVAAAAGLGCCAQGLKDGWQRGVRLRERG
jgi:hypothetical protein